MPKNTQKIIGWIVSVLLLAAFLFYAHRVYGGSSSVSDVSLMIVTCVAGIQVVALCCMEDYGAALLEKLAKIEAYHATVSSASTSLNYTYAGVESPVESQRERLRREHELIMVHGASSVIAERPGQAQDVANGIKVFLDGLEGCAEGQAPAGDMPACKGINCGCTDGRSHSNECIVEAAMIQGWAGDKEARDAFAAIQSKNFASRAATESAATQPATSPTQGDDAIEAEIHAKGKTAPRITPADIEASIASEHYFTARDGRRGALHEETYVGRENPTPDNSDLLPLDLLTFCVLVLRNGFTVTGESACASPENFNAEIGRRIARENAVAKIWPLLGFRLRDKISGD